jgi:hypothetical protein
MANQAEKTFFNRKLVMKVYMKLVMIMELD